MKQLILYIIFLMSMVFSGYGEVSAASISLSHQDSLTVKATDAGAQEGWIVCGRSQPFEG